MRRERLDGGSPGGWAPSSATAPRLLFVFCTFDISSFFNLVIFNYKKIIFWIEKCVFHVKMDYRIKVAKNSKIKDANKGLGRKG